MNENLAKQEFVIFDVETTGLSPVDGDRIIEIAAIKVKNLKAGKKFYSFINPKREIPFGATQVNGITSDMVAAAPGSQEVLSGFLDFLGDAALVGHNVRFDLGFLCFELSLFDQWLKDDIVVVDTLKMARAILPGLGRYPLWAVAKSLGLSTEQKHRAAEDTQLTFEVFAGLVKTMGEKTLEETGILPGALDEFKMFRKRKKEQAQEFFRW